MSSPPSTVSDVQQKAQDENPMINQLDQVALSPPQTFSVQTPVLQHSTILDNEDHGHDQDDEEAVTSKYPYLSPDGEAPRRILSSHSLIGENIDDETTPASFRRTSSGFDSELSPFTPTSQEDDSDNGFGVNITNNSITPPLSIQEPPASLSPPLFTTYRSSDSVAESSLKEPVFHQPSPQFHHLQPRTHMIPSIGYGRNHNRVQPSSSSVDATLRAASEKLSVATAGTVFNQHTSSNNSHSLGMGKPFLRPPRAPQSSSLQSSPYRNGPEQLSTLEVARLANSTNTNSGTGGAGHSRVPTDSTNFTFMSALTDATAEYGMPRRRTKSLDETQDTVTRGGDKRRKGPQQNGGNTKRIGRGTPVATEHSTSGVSLPGSILQPILSEGENTPPISILASNLKKPLPAVGQPTLIPSTSSVTEGMCTPIARIEESVLFPPTRSVPRSSLSVSEGMSNDTLSEIRMGLPRITLSPRSSIGDRSPLPPFLHPQIFENNFTEKKVNDAGGKNDSRHPSPSLEATSGSASLMGNGQTRQRHLADSPEAIDVIQNTEKRSILVRMVMNTESFYAASLVMLLVAFGIDLRSLIASLRGVFVGVAILLSTLGQKQLQGILLIHYYKAFRVGDRISFTNTATKESYPDIQWIVQEVDAFTTTMLSTSNAKHTVFSNSFLAGSNITNLRQSLPAIVSISLKFSTDAADTGKVGIFRRRITSWIESRSHEWMKVNSFRLARIESHLKFVEYILTLQHRESWQEIETIEESKSEVLGAAWNLQKELKLVDVAP